MPSMSVAARGTGNAKRGTHGLGRVPRRDRRDDRGGPGNLHSAWRRRRDTVPGVQLPVRSRGPASHPTAQARDDV